jgi:hypothetical protein
MASFCAFGSHDGQLSEEGSFHFTILGGANFRRPPAAHLIAGRRRTVSSGFERPPHFFLTLFGDTAVSWPTLAEEYLAACEALDGGTLTLQDWDQTVGQPGVIGGLRAHALTLFGGFNGSKAPSEEDELDALTLQRHAGQIPPPAVELLMLGIGQIGVQRLSAVRNALAAAMAKAS